MNSKQISNRLWGDGVEGGRLMTVSFPARLWTRQPRWEKLRERSLFQRDARRMLNAFRQQRWWKDWWAALERAFWSPGRDVCVWRTSQKRFQAYREAWWRPWCDRLFDAVQQGVWRKGPWWSKARPKRPMASLWRHSVCWVPSQFWKLLAGDVHSRWTVGRSARRNDNICKLESKWAFDENENLKDYASVYEEVIVSTRSWTDTVETAARGQCVQGHSEVVQRPSFKV